MLRGIRRVLFGAAIAALAFCPALAGDGTITTKDASGTTRTFSIVTDGSGNFIARHVLCDATAAASCATVAAGAVSVSLAANQTVNVAQILGAAPSLTNPLWVFPATGATFPISGTVTATGPLTDTQLRATAVPVSGTVTAAQATAASLNATVVGTGTFAVQAASTLAAETTKVLGTIRVVGNVGGVLDAIGQNVAAPANWWQIGCQFNTTPTTITSTNGSPVQCDNGGRLLATLSSASPIVPATATATKTNLLGVQYNSTQATFTDGQQGAAQATSRGELKIVNMDAAGNARGANVDTNNNMGVVLAAETSKVLGTVRIASGGVASGSFASGALASGSIASGAMVDLGAQADSTCGTATGTCSLIALTKYNNSIGLVPGTATAPSSSYIAVNAAPGASPIPVISGGSLYETVAASQTAQVLGPTGATGDYLSHCVIYPTTTTPGVVTVFDNANAAATNAIAFPGGASSVSNLAPIAIPVGAISTAGAWKVTTGANLVVTCYGKFT